MSDFTANDKSHFKISLPMLVQAVGGVALIAAMWTSTQADLHALQKDVGQLQDQVKTMLELQDKPIPSDIRQDTRLDHFEKQLDRIEGVFYNR